VAIPFASLPPLPLALRRKLEQTMHKTLKRDAICRCCRTKTKSILYVCS
jgi:hypothetical protein